VAQRPTAKAGTTSSLVSSRNNKKVVCYYANWSAYRPGQAKFLPQNINPYLCTHLIYAFGGFTNDFTLRPFDKWQDIDQGSFSTLFKWPIWDCQLFLQLSLLSLSCLVIG
jgi:chitinase